MEERGEDRGGEERRQRGGEEVERRGEREGRGGRGEGTRGGGDEMHGRLALTPIYRFSYPIRA